MVLPRTAKACTTLRLPSSVCILPCSSTRSAGAGESAGAALAGAALAAAVAIASRVIEHAVNIKWQAYLRIIFLFPLSRPRETHHYAGDQIEHLRNARDLTPPCLIACPLRRIDRGPERSGPTAQRMHDFPQGAQSVHRSRPATRGRDTADGAAAQVGPRVRA